MSNGERRRKGDLTPMSGELNARADWVPPGPVAEQYRPKEEKGQPVTRTQILLGGLIRIAVVLVTLSALLVGIALLFMRGGTEASRAFPLTFILGGGLITVGGFLGATTGPVADWMPERGFSYPAREHAFNRSFVYGAFGLVFVGIGIALDAYL